MPLSIPISSQLSTTPDFLRNVTQATHDLAQDIDLLQDRLYSIPNLVGINAPLEELEDWNPTSLNLLEMQPEIHGSNEDHATLMALMQNQANFVSMPGVVSSKSTLPAFTSMDTCSKSTAADPNLSSNLQMNSILDTEETTPLLFSPNQLPTPLQELPIEELENFIDLPDHPKTSPIDDIDQSVFDEFFKT